MGKRITLVTQSALYRNDHKAWNDLRFAGACLAQDMALGVRLLDEAVEAARQGHNVHESKVNLEPPLAELGGCGLSVSACGKALDDCAISAEEMLPGIKRGSMKLLAGWIAESDLAY